MKALKFIILGSLVASSLLACSVENDLILPTEDIQQNNQLSSQSAKGLNDFMDFQAKFTFDKMDVNNNKYLSKTEYINYFVMSTPVPSEPPLAQDNEKIESISALSNKEAISGEPAIRFNSIDKNKDGRITLTEARKSVSNFLGTSKNEMRKMVTLMFNYMDKNQNKNVSKDEFMVSFQDAPYSVKTNMLSNFNMSDKNRNSSLNFSEFEDMYYSITKAYMEVPFPVPSDSPNPVPVPSSSVDPVPSPSDSPNPVPAPSETPNIPA